MAFPANNCKTEAPICVNIGIKLSVHSFKLAFFFLVSSSAVYIYVEMFKPKCSNIGELLVLLSSINHQ